MKITYSSSSDEEVELDVEEISYSSVESSDENGNDIFSSDSNLDGLPDAFGEAIHDTESNDEFISREKHLEHCIKEV